MVVPSCDGYSDAKAATFDAVTSNEFRVHTLTLEEQRAPNLWCHINVFLDRSLK